MAVKVYFGVPGSGKTTYAAKIAKKCKRKKIKCFANFPCKYTYYYNASDLGSFDISNCVLIIDEASIDFNNRAYRSLPQKTIQYLKYYRHYGVRDILIFSQDYADMDVTLRRLSTEYYLITKKSRFFITVKQAIKKIAIDKDTKQFIDAYAWRFRLPEVVFGPFYWHMFDSWSAPALPVKDFPYNSGNNK